MKRTIIISGIIVVAAFILLVIFNKVVSKKDETSLYAEALKGAFEITVTGTGELIAEKSVDILAPEMVERNSGGGGPRGGGGDIRMAPLRIQDLVKEGTMVKKGDFIAQLDRTEYDNTLKDDRDRLKTFETNLEMKILDSAVVLSGLRDDIKNQRYLVSEAAMTLRNSRYESPDVIRQAEITYDKAQRVLEQKERTYALRVAQTRQDIKNTQFFISRVTSRVNSLEDLLNQFTITSPSDGMVIYKRDFRGSKRKVGTMISPFDRVVATIPDLSSMISRTFISEIEVNKIKPGQSVDITIDAFPLRTYKGTVFKVANIGEVLPNSDSKVFETQIKIAGMDPDLRPSMTTGNKIIIQSLNDVVYIPTECILSGSDSIPFVYTKNRLRQVVLTGESNDKYTVIKKGLKEGTVLYISEPENHEKFRLSGKDLIPEIREQNKARLGLAQN
jgi:multidrug efflux pump subunit AcrA (membrane-fusion protein)